VLDRSIDCAASLRDKRVCIYHLHRKNSVVMTWELFPMYLSR
jgi:hypothetical protein